MNSPHSRLATRFSQTFRMHRASQLAWCLLTFALTAAPAVAIEQPLPRSTPEAQGVSSSDLVELVEALDNQFNGMHSLMIVRHGHVITEGWWRPYDARHNHVLYSLSKSFTSTAVGLAVAEKKISINDVVIEIFPDQAPTEVSANLKAMRVRDLLTMATGHQDPPSAAADTISAESFLAHPVPHLPGTHFKYNTAATFMQSAIVQQASEQTVLEYLQPRLFEPLGIEDPVWDTNYQGISLGGYGLRVKTEDIAKFGQLYLQQGQWNGQQVLPADWVKMATSKQVSNGSNPNSDWNQGYGFQFWRCRHNAYRGDGAFGQYCIVLPDQEVVIAITSGVRDMQAILNVLWDKLLPALKDAPLPENNSAHDRLVEQLAALVVPPAEGTATSPIADQVLNQAFSVAENEQQIERVELTSQDDGKTVALNLVQDGKSLRYAAGFEVWKPSRSALLGSTRDTFPDEPVAGTFAWDGNTAIIKVCAVETPFHWVIRLEFSDDTVTLNAEANVAFGPTKLETLVGKRVSDKESR